MKIIHCGDIHLDSAMGSNFSAVQSRERNAELCATFGHMVSFAVREQVQAVLIAGDLFDSGYVTARTIDYILEQMRNAAEVTFFYLRGNHDACSDAFEGMALPVNLKTFGNCWTDYPCGDVVITGMEPEGNDWYSMYDRLELNDQRLNIVMLHGQIGTQAGVEQIALPRLKGKGIDYLALGHLHRYHQGQLDMDSQYCYCGCLEGRGFDECGEKGFVLLETDGHRLISRFVPFASRMLHEIFVDITDLDTVTQMLNAMKQASSGISRDDLVKFVLHGTFTLQTQKDIPFLQKMLEQDFYCVKITDESRLKIQMKNYAFDMSLKGEFVRLVQASDCSDEEKEQIICCGIRALSGEEVLQ